MWVYNSVPSLSRLSLLFCAWLLCSSLVSSVRGQDLTAYLAARHAPLSVGQRRLASALRDAAQMAARYGPAAVGALDNRVLRVQPDGSVEVYIYTARLTPSELQSLELQGVHIIQILESSGMVYAAVAPEALEPVAALPFVRWVQSPLPGTLRIGSVTSLGDLVLRAAEARNMFGVDGSGVRIGIVSDSLINLDASVASNDLPSNVIIVNGEDGSTLVGSTDEGRALAEIIHDLAPGATLLFHSGFPTEVAMINAINALINAGADIIIDDIGFFGEPIFEDGIIAQAVQNAINAGVVYVTATGNDADRHYRGLYVDADPGDPAVNLHDFGGGDTTLDVLLDPGDTMIGVLQWPNRFNGSQNTVDYDLLVRDANGAVDACTLPGITGTCTSMADQTTTQAPPLESIVVTNTSGVQVRLTILINRVSGTDPALLEMHFSRGARLQEHIVAASSIFGHPCVVEVLAVGAISASDPGFDTIEPFSSQGPCEIFFPTREDRTKPDLVASDGVNTSLPSFSPFFGTSSAAPHVAAIAALLMDAAGGPNVFSNTQIADFLRQAAIDLGAAGLDNIFGNGAVDAVEAILALLAVAPPANPGGGGGGGGGGGCSLLLVSSSGSILDAIGNILLPVVVLLLIRTWRWYRSRT